MRKIDSVWLAVAEEVENDAEGVCAIMLGGKWMPLIAADPERLEFIMLRAAEVAVASGRRVRIIRLSTREEVEVFDGRGDDR